MAKVVMISGGGRGLGAAITRKLLSEKWQVSLGLRDTNQVDAFEAGPSVKIIWQIADSVPEIPADRG